MLVHVQERVQFLQSRQLRFQLLLTGEWLLHLRFCRFQLRVQLTQLLTASLLLERQRFQQIIHALDIAEHIGTQRHHMAQLPDHGQTVFL